MLLSRRSLLIKFFKLFDIATVVFTFLLTYFIVTGERISFSALASMQIKIKLLPLLIFLVFVWHFIFSYAGLYKSKRIGAKLQECIDILKCTSFGSLFMLVIGSIFDVALFNKAFVSAFWLNSSLVMIIGRIGLRYILAVARTRGINQRFVLIVGTGERAIKFADIVQKRKELGYKLLGFVDDKWISEKKSASPGHLLSNLQGIPKILNENVVDEVIIGLPIKSCYDKIKEIIEYCETQGIIVRFLTDIFTFSLVKSRLDFLDETPVLSLYFAPYEDPRMLIKRLIDLAFSVMLLILFSPLFLVVAMLIKLTTPGSIFFLQERVGYNKRVFKIIKFRTMVENAEGLLSSIEHLNETEGPTFKIKDDPRITSIGRVLRKTSIDELPQLINVLMGDMSLVGPRPLPVRDYQGFDADWQKRRFSMKPGITCFWQIEGRHSISFYKWMELDMKYIDKWSLWLDLKIMCKTIPAVIKGKGAM